VVILWDGAKNRVALKAAAEGREKLLLS
jgi:hypothetical protein